MNEPFVRLVEQFRHLPGIGMKTARRLAYFMLEESDESVKAFVDSIYAARQEMKYCSICGHLSSADPCEFCSDVRRDASVICVVETTSDVWSIERSQGYRGQYHVLNGVLSPLDGVGPECLRIKELLERLRDQEVNEVIVATDPDVEGEATALYLAKLIKPSGIKVTRIARGLPVGGDIDFVDGVTLAGAVTHRTEL